MMGHGNSGNKGSIVLFEGYDVCWEQSYRLVVHGCALEPGLSKTDAFSTYIYVYDTF